MDQTPQDLTQNRMNLIKNVSKSITFQHCSLVGIRFCHQIFNWTNFDVRFHCQISNQTAQLYLQPLQPSLPCSDVLTKKVGSKTANHLTVDVFKFLILYKIKNSINSNLAVVDEIVQSCLLAKVSRLEYESGYFYLLLYVKFVA